MTETLQTGWKQTLQPGPVNITTSGQVVENVNFGNFKLGKICGMKFNDLNGNGVKDPGEPGLPGWWIRLSTGALTVTDVDGNYCFTNLFKGHYSMTETLQSGWKQTLQPNPVDITTSGQVITDVNFGNFKLGKICGMKFNDLNGNGVKDPGEPGLPGWKIKLNIGGVVVTTDANGYYCFTNLVKGNYILIETLQPGWKQTLKPDPISITTSGQVVENANFGNFLLGKICGMKFNDLNGNGVKDAGEPGLSGWKITLSTGATAYTDADGNYCFVNLFTGDYTLTETLQPGWKQTLQPNPVSITTSGQVITDVNFGNFQLGKICGMKFDDLNGNGVKDAGEPGLSGWRIVLSTGAVVFTDADGNYCFANLDKGNYTLSETLQVGWKQTLQPGQVSITSSGQVITDVNFGNFKLGKICGLKFEDMNGNGAKDAGEPTLSGWWIKLSNGMNTQTDADGNYCFTNLDKGDYTLSETLQPGWKQTLQPDPVSITTSGQVVTDVNFGNFKLGKICGMKFNDLNGNGVKDPGEPGLSGWRIVLSTGAVVYTDADGNYCFTNVFKGDYTLSETMQAGWKQTLQPGPVSITSSGQVVTDVNFGNFLLGKICGMKFYDSNGNGVKDPGEPGIRSWKIKLSTGTVVSTDVNGNYCFANLDLGSYTVTEAHPVQSGWLQTYPAVPGTYTITITTSGQVANNEDFGNLRCGAGGGKTIGFWSNKNGQALTTSASLFLLSSLNLCNGDGSDFNPTVKTQIPPWLLSANAVNSAYMLSAQLAAMELNVSVGFVNGNAYIYAPGTTSANPLGYATVNAVMAEANTELGLHPICTTTVNAGFRDYQLALKTALDNANQDASTTFILPPIPPYSF